MSEPLTTALPAALPAPGEARPKVLRRPPQLARTTLAERLPAHAPAATEPAPAAQTAPTRRWQEDGRFAIALLLIILGVNVLVTVWLSMITVRTSEATPTAEVAEPTRMGTSGQTITVHILDETSDTPSDQ